jgi:hypothetical protein
VMKFNDSENEVGRRAKVSVRIETLYHTLSWSRVVIREPN